MVVGLNYLEAPGGGGSGGGATGLVVLTEDPYGGWSGIQHPKAMHYNGYTYPVWVNGVTSELQIGIFNEATQAPGIARLLDTPGLPTDDHNNPAVLIKADKHVLIAFSLHGGPNVFVRTSVSDLDADPELEDGFGAAGNLDFVLGGSRYTYPVLMELDNGHIYCFIRNIPTSSYGRLIYTKSTNNGNNYDTGVNVFRGASSTKVPYWCIRQAGNRIDVMTTDGRLEGSDGPVDLGHFYIDGTDEKVYRSDGTEITAAKPFQFSELTDLLETNQDGVIACDGIAGANPRFVYLVADNTAGEVTLKHTRWNGTAWDTDVIYTHDDFPIDQFYGWAAIDPSTDPTTDLTVYTGKHSGSNESEMWKYHSADNGATWDAGTQLTTGTGPDEWNASPAPVVDGVAAMPVVWLRGLYIAQDDFHWGIMGEAG